MIGQDALTNTIGSLRFVPAPSDGLLRTDDLCQEVADCFVQEVRNSSGSGASPVVAWRRCDEDIFFLSRIDQPVWPRSNPK